MVVVKAVRLLNGMNDIMDRAKVENTIRMFAPMRSTSAAYTSELKQCPRYLWTDVQSK